MDRSILITGILLFEIVKMRAYFASFQIWDTVFSLRNISLGEAGDSGSYREAKPPHLPRECSLSLPTALPRGLPSQEEKRRSSRRADCLALKGGFQDGNVVHSLTLLVAKWRGKYTNGQAHTQRCSAGNLYTPLCSALKTHCHSSPFTSRKVLIFMTSLKNYILRPNCWVLSGKGGVLNLLHHAVDALFLLCALLKAGCTIKRLVCRQKGNNLTGASQSMTSSAPFENYTSSLALILTPPSAEQITPLQFHNSGRLLSHPGYRAVSSFWENPVRQELL